MAQQSANALWIILTALPVLRKWPVVTEHACHHFGTARDKPYHLITAVSTVTGWCCIYQCKSGRGLYSATYSTSKSNRSGFSGHAKYSQFRSHRTHSCFFTWKSRHLLIPVTSDFFHCIIPLAPRPPPTLTPFPLCSRGT